jgi:hypothetical protein
MNIGNLPVVNVKVGDQSVIRVLQGNINTTGQQVWPTIIPSTGFPFKLPLKLK